MGKDLADRVQDRANGQGEGTVATRGPVTLAEQVERMATEYQRAMPQGFEAQQLIRDALTLMRVNPQLGECTPASVLGGLMTFAQLGLRPGVMGQGWLIPFKNWKHGNRLEAQIVIGYQGYVELAHRSKMVTKMIGRAVHAKDTFDVEYGIDEHLLHKPYRGDGGRGPVTDYYAIIHMGAGSPLFWTMTRQEAIEWRDKFAMSAKRDKKTGAVTGSGPWFDMDGPPGGTGFDQMAIKTCFLRAKRWSPKSTDRDLTRAAEVDGGVRMQYSPDDPDEMLTADHPQPRHTYDIEGEVVEQPAETAAATVETPESETPPADFKPATQPMHRRIMALLGQSTVDDAHRHAVYAAIVDRPIASGKQLSTADASQIIDQLTAWKKADELQVKVAELIPDDTAAAAVAVDGAERPPATAELPTVNTQAWHNDRHPVVRDGEIERVDLAPGECDVCEAADADESGQQTLGAES